MVDGKDQALFCEGEGCNSWIHRYCSGVPARYFEQLSSSSSPFYCFVCSLWSHADEISSLKSSLTSLIDDISRLRTESERRYGSCEESACQLQWKIYDLSSRLNDAMPSAAFVGDSQPSSSGNSHFLGNGGGEGAGWVRGRGMGGGGSGWDRGRGSRGMGGRVGYGGQGKWHTPDGFRFGSGSGSGSCGDGVGGGGGGSRSADARSPPKLAKKVSGARRVWGTMSMCSESAVKGAIERICGII